MVVVVDVYFAGIICHRAKAGNLQRSFILLQHVRQVLLPFAVVFVRLFCICVADWILLPVL